MRAGLICSVGLRWIASKDDKVASHLGWVHGHVQKDKGRTKGARGTA